ncbi:hypothetical protein [Streptomyces rubiginosohelvolus]|uniref:Uncharacterized protein n=1 Tax=Streptomyces rubiginosohelvolus TaxID=67362 RepID=A0ABQ3CDA2_9ACTN|nr:hypothetical protein [Streptomyces pluricolorescens]GGZ82725.1 hypothetical protein GCM10010328_66430 [Streptomyces pluricolorescens]
MSLFSRKTTEAKTAKAKKPAASAQAGTAASAGSIGNAVTDAHGVHTGRRINR